MPVKKNHFVKHKLSHLVFLLVFSVFLNNTLAGEEIYFKSHDIKVNGAKDFRFMKRYPGAVIFDYLHKAQDEYNVLLSSILLKESEDPQHSGYHAKTTREISGEITRLVYDYPETSSPGEVLEVVRKRLKKQGFNELFFCSKQACGAAAGWRAYLYGKLGTSDTRQYYLATQKAQTTVVFYINDLSGQPRGVLDVVVTAPESAYNKTLAQENGTTAIYFEVGMFNVNLSPVDHIKELVELALKEEKTIVVKGYADASGNRDENQALSLKRAQEVKKFLTEHFSVPEGKIETEGLGVAQPASHRMSLLEKASDRRVELLLRDDSIESGLLTKGDLLTKDNPTKDNPKS